MGRHRRLKKSLLGDEPPLGDLPPPNFGSIGDILSMGNILEEIMNTPWTEEISTEGSTLSNTPRPPITGAEIAGTLGVPAGIGLQAGLEGLVKKKRKKRGKYKKTIEKENMSKEDININKIKNNLNNIYNTNKLMPIFHRSINTGNHGMSNPPNNNELEVKPIPKSLSSIVPDYFTIRLPIRSTDMLTWTTGYDSTTVRLNDLNSTFAHASTLDFLGLSQWKALFTYYRIVSGKLSVGFFNVSNTEVVTALIDQTARYTIELTDSATPRLSTARQMAEAKHNITGLVHTRVGDEGFTSYAEYNYTPKNFTEMCGHVSETGDEDTWNAVTSAPTHTHYAHIGAVNNWGVGTASDTQRLRLDIKYEIVVQFREVIDTILVNSQTT